MNIRLIRTEESTVNLVEILNSVLLICTLSVFVNFNILYFLVFVSIKNKVCITSLYSLTLKIGGVCFLETLGRLCDQ